MRTRENTLPIFLYDVKNIQIYIFVEKIVGLKSLACWHNQGQKLGSKVKYVQNHTRKLKLILKYSWMKPESIAVNSICIYLFVQKLRTFEIFKWWQKVQYFGFTSKVEDPVKSKPMVRSKKYFGFGVFSQHTTYIPKSITIHEGRVPNVGISVLVWERMTLFLLCHIHTDHMLN